jgi:hypothetical protein
MGSLRVLRLGIRWKPKRVDKQDEKDEKREVDRKVGRSEER